MTKTEVEKLLETEFRASKTDKNITNWIAIQEIEKDKKLEKFKVKKQYENEEDGFNLSNMLITTSGREQDWKIESRTMFLWSIYGDEYIETKMEESKYYNKESIMHPYTKIWKGRGYGELYKILVDIFKFKK